MDFLRFKYRLFNENSLATLFICLSIGITHTVHAESQMVVPAVSQPDIKQPTALTAVVVEPNGILTLQAALGLARQYQPLQALWQARQDIAIANLHHSKQWSNPEIAIEQTGLKQQDERELTIGISQQLDLFGVRRARQQLANIAIDSENIHQLAYQSQLDLAVNAAYWRVAQAEWLLQLMQEQKQLSANSEQVAKRRLQAGRIAEVEYLRVLVSDQQMQAQLDAAQDLLSESRFQLTRLWGNTQPAFSHTQSAVLPAPIFPDVNAAQLLNTLSHNPQQQLLMQQQRQAQASLNLAQAQAKPQPTVSFGVNRTRTPALQNTLDHRLTLGVSIPMPIFNRNQGVIKANQALNQINTTRQHYVLEQRNQQLQAGLLKLDHLARQYHQVQQQQLPLAKTIQQKTVLGFEAGKFSVTEVQQATRDYQAIQFNQLQLLSQAWQLSLQLQAISLGLSADFDMNNSNYMDNNQLELWQDAQTMPLIGAGE